MDCILYYFVHFAIVLVCFRLKWAATLQQKWHSLVGSNMSRQCLRLSREAQLAGEVAFVRQQARLLLDRLQLLGEGAGEAARRREWAEQASRAEARERRAQLVCLQRGRNIRRSGFGYVD